MMLATEQQAQERTGPITKAEMRELGQKDGEGFAALIIDRMTKFGEHVPEGFVDAATYLVASEIVACEIRLRAVGLSERLIEAYSQSCRATYKHRIGLAALAARAAGAKH